MATLAACAACGQRFKCKDEWAGRRVRCPKCGQAVSIPALDAAASPAKRQQAPQPPAAAASRAELPQPATDDLLSLLGDDLGAGGGALAGGQLGNPLGLPPRKRSGKSGSNKTPYIVLGIAGGVGVLAICGGIVVAILLPAVHAARLAALKAQASNAAGSQQSAPVSPTPLVGNLGPLVPSGPDWTPDAKFADQLPTQASFDRYTLQLPPDFKPQTLPAPPPPDGLRIQSHYWGGIPSLRGNAVVGVNVIDLTQGVIRPHELDLALTKFLQALQATSQMTDYRSEPNQSGRLAGKACVRTRFTAKIRELPMRGRAYFFMDGDRRALMTIAMCPEGHASPTFEQIEAALLTLH